MSDVFSLGLGGPCLGSGHLFGGKFGGRGGGSGLQLGGGLGLGSGTTLGGGLRLRSGATLGGAFERGGALGLGSGGGLASRIVSDGGLSANNGALELSPYTNLHSQGQQQHGLVNSSRLLSQNSTNADVLSGEYAFLTQYRPCMYVRVCLTSRNKFHQPYC